MESPEASTSTSRGSARRKDHTIYNEIKLAEACSSTYLPEWKKSLFSEDNDWDANVTHFGFNGRLHFFNVSRDLGIKDDYSWAQGARILEKYLSITLNGGSSIQQLKLYHSLRRGKQRVIRKMCKERNNGQPNNLVLMTVCIVMAAKMTSRRSEISMKKICSFLRLFHSHEDALYMKKLEFKIFKTLGFRLPLWSTLEVAELVSQAVGMSPECLIVIKPVSIVAEIHRRMLEELWEDLGDMENKPVLIKHIGALVVSTTCLYIIYPQRKIVFQRLAALMMKSEEVIYRVTCQALSFFHESGFFL